MLDSATGNRLFGGVLAGGKSDRMGTCKAQLRMPTGETLLDHALECLKPYTEEIVVSVKDADQPVPRSSRVVIDDVPFLGPVAGIVALLSDAHQHNAAAVFVLSVDLPDLSFGALSPLVCAWCDDRDSICVATVDETFPEPLIAIYPVQYLPALRQLLGAEDRSITRWLQSQETKMVPIARSIGTSVNTPSQWKAVYDRLKNS